MGAFYLHPLDAQAVFLHNDLLCNGTCSVTGNAHNVLWGAGNGKDPAKDIDRPKLPLRENQDFVFFIAPEFNWERTIIEFFNQKIFGSRYRNCQKLLSNDF